MVDMHVTYYVVLFIIFCILSKVILIDPRKRLEKSDKICLFYRQLAYVYLLQLMQAEEICQCFSGFNKWYNKTTLWNCLVELVKYLQNNKNSSNIIIARQLNKIWAIVMHLQI